MEKIELFLIIVVADMFAMLIFMLIKDAVEKNVSIFRTWKNTRLYHLSFVYARAKELRKLGYSDTAICNQLKKEFENNSLPFLLYPPRMPKDISKKRKMKKYNERLEDYKKAVDFVGQVIANPELLKKYVITPDFGKGTDKELMSKLNTNDIQQAAYDALKKCLSDESEENINDAMKWFPSLFISPYIIPEKLNLKVGKIENSAAVFYALSKSTEFFKKDISLRAYIDCLSKLQAINPTMTIAKSPGDISKYSNKVQSNTQWNDWKKAILDKAKRMSNLKIC